MKKFLLAGALLNFAVANGVFATQELPKTNFSAIAEVESTRVHKLTPEQRVEIFGIEKISFQNDSVAQAILDDDFDSFVSLSAIPEFKETKVANYSLMQFAALCGAAKCFRYLTLNLGTDLAVSDIAVFAVAGGNQDIIERIVRENMDFSNTIDERSIKLVDMSIVEWIFDNFHPDEEKVFLNACRSGRLDILLYLANKYVNGDIKTYVDGVRDFETPLHFASWDGHLDIVKYLVEECHANVEAEDNGNWTPLHVASEGGHLDIVKYLVEECHANVEAKDNAGKTPLHEASLMGYLDIVKCLVANNANVEAKDSYGKTPLHEASLMGDLDIVKYLVENNANVNVKDNFSMTPLDLAKTQEIKTYLQSKM